MATDLFNTIIPQEQRAKALEMYDPLAKTQEGQLEILSQASKGKAEAAIYLYVRLVRVIAKAFWKYYLGPEKQHHQRRIKAGADREFISMVFEILMDGERNPSPYKTFDSSKFSSDADLIKQFAYYLYRYLQNEAFKHIRGGDTTSGEVNFDDSGAEDEEFSADHAEDIDQRETLNAFYRFLLAKDKKAAQIFKLASQGMQIQQIADKIGMSFVGTRRIVVTKIQPLWEEFNK